MPRKPAPKSTRPADASQNSEGDAAASSGSPTTGKRLISKTEAVRLAIAAGADRPIPGTDYIKREFGLEISKEHFSSTKSNLKKRADAGGSPRALVEGYLAPPRRPAADAGESDLIAAMEAMKPLVENLGADKVKRIVDLLG